MLLFIAGLISFILAIAGAILPVMPAGPFLILAAYFFSRSSKRFHDKLRESKYTGYVVTEWEDHGVITLPAKAGLTAFVVSSFGYSIYFDTHTWLQAAIGIAGFAFLVWTWTRPSKVRPT